MSGGKKTKGKQKIEIKKIKKESDLLVTFLKRRNGLFKKANELFTGAYFALIIFSPSGRVFFFGYPDVYSIIDRFLSWVQTPINFIRRVIEATGRNTNARVLNADQLTLLNDALDIEKQIGEDLSHLCRMTEDSSWWASPIDGLNQAQLEILKIALEELNKHVNQQADDGVVILDAPIQTEQAQMLQTIFFLQNPMLNPHLMGFNNMEDENMVDPPDPFDLRDYI